MEKRHTTTVGSACESVCTQKLLINMIILFSVYVKYRVWKSEGSNNEKH